MKIFLLLLTTLLLTSALHAQALFPVDKFGKAGFIDVNGKVVIPMRFDEVRQFREGLAGARVGRDWGYIDTTGEFVIKPQFFEISPFSEGLASVGVYYPGKKVIRNSVGFYSYIDRTGKLITTERFGVAFEFFEGVARVLTEDNKHIYIDRTGRHLFEFLAEDFSNGRAMFQTDGNMPDSKTGFLDKTGTPAIPATYRSGEDFSEGLACVYTAKGAGFIDTSGKTVIDFKYKYCRSFSDGLAAVYTDDAWGFVDKTGQLVIAPKFGEVSGFSEGLAVVRATGSVNQTRMKVGDKTVAVEEGLFGVIDKSGQFVIPPKFTQMHSFENGLALVNLSDEYVVHGYMSRWGYINKKGEMVWKSF